MHSKSEIRSTVVNSVLGVNVAGYVNSEFGLGEGVRGTIKAIEATGIPFVINNCTFNPHRKLDSSYQDFTEANPYPINIVQVNVDLINTFINSVNQNYFKDRYNIGFWAWELQTFPQEWKQAFNIFNEIWTCSSYCVESIAMVSPVPVIKVMHSISLPTPSIHREMLGLPPGKFIFLFIFDFCSAFERKNPVATIKAFKQAFGLNDDVLLVIKCSNAEQFPEQRKQLKDIVTGDPSIKLIDGYLLRDEMNALIYNCDCYVSLHRSEGFGLTMAEAMFYGKPVIATAYSANTEYMNVGNSFLVKYDLITLSEDFGPYRKGNLWANPDTEHAASLMRHVFDNYEEALRVGKRASQEVRSLLNPQAIGSKIRSRLEYVGLVTNGFTSISPLDQAQAKITQLHTELVRSQSQLEQTQAELVRSQSQLQQTQAELVGSQSQLQQTQAELVGSQSQLEQTQAELVGSQSQLQQTQAELVGLQSQLQHVQVELERSQSRITAMESSKFWKLRTSWFRLRKLIGMVGNE